MPYLFCLPFPKHASDSGDLYIDFNRNQLTFPVALLDFQVEARFNHFLPKSCICTAYRIPHIISCSCVGCLLCCVLLSGVSSSWLHLLHGLVLLPCGISGKMTATLDLTTIIAMLAASFYRFAAQPIFCSSSLPNCHVSL